MDVTTLQYSFIGNETVTETINGRSVIDVVMVQSAQELDVLVVVGYGTVKKRDLTGAVSSLKPTEILKSATSNPLQSMQGKIAGIDVMKSSGEAGSGVTVNLRGNRSVNAINTPLYLVDGIEYG
jgi:hypothetical protein